MTSFDCRGTQWQDSSTPLPGRLQAARSRRIFCADKSNTRIGRHGFGRTVCIVPTGAWILHLLLRVKCFKFIFGDHKNHTGLYTGANCTAKQTSCFIFLIFQQRELATEK
jgi:hypothetical protein